MRSKRPLILFVIAFAVVLGFLTIATPLFAASKEKVLHSFGNGKDGAYPWASLIFDPAGNLYGTTKFGGGSGKGCSGYACGTVFELTPRANGKWKEKVLHSFEDNGRDGWGPLAGLVFEAGNLYGTTSAGGTHGGGVVFEITP